MIGGYKSTISFSGGMAAVGMVWVVAGVLTIAANALALVGPAGSSLVDPRLPISVRGGLVLLMLFTVGVGGYWSVQASDNVRRLGTPRGPGFFSFNRPLWLIGILAVVALNAVVSGSPFARPFLVIGLSATIFLSAGLHRVLSRLWASGVPLGEPDIATPWPNVLVASFATTAALLLTGALLSEGQAFLFAGLVLGVAAVGLGVSAMSLLPLIARRQDARLIEIIDGADQITGTPQTSVTAQQIESAWQDSADLVQFTD